MTVHRLSGYPDSMATDDPALLDLDSTREAHQRLALALQELAALSPEAAALRTLTHRVMDSLDTRDVRALDSNHAEREIQFLADLRDAVEGSLSNAIPYANKKRGVTWQRVGDLLGVSRQSAHERYAV